MYAGGWRAPAFSCWGFSFLAGCAFRLANRDAPKSEQAFQESVRIFFGDPVQTAWKIDQPRAKFVKVPSEGLSCPRNGISTDEDGR